MPIESPLPPDEIRASFSRALSAMYAKEVPLYGDLLGLVADINAQALAAQPDLARRLDAANPLDGLAVERHGAIRLGTAQEMAIMRRLFAVMGLQPVGYYDLAPAGIPVHATAFRPVDAESLRANPFRVFTSLLRLELIEDADLRRQAAEILARRTIFTPRCIELIAQAEREGGLDAQAAQALVAEALETFRWHQEATVDLDTYRRLRAQHPLIADVVCFKGPHINHLTPRVLDIDAAQAEMIRRGIPAKDRVEGPPRRKHPILLRQTSFLALEERIRFPGEAPVDGTHTARFGEIEQRGMALTPKGRALYDELLQRAFAAEREGVAKADALAQAFAGFPDDADRLRQEGLAFFRYTAVPGTAADPALAHADTEALLRAGRLEAEPLTYQDFLPVSAAGIFRSNLGDRAAGEYEQPGDQRALEAALGCPILSEFSLYATMQAASLDTARAAIAKAPQGSR